MDTEWFVRLNWISKSHWLVQTKNGRSTGNPNEDTNEMWQCHRNERKWRWRNKSKKSAKIFQTRYKSKNNMLCATVDTELCRPNLEDRKKFLNKMQLQDPRGERRNQTWIVVPRADKEKALRVWILRTRCFSYFFELWTWVPLCESLEREKKSFTHMNSSCSQYTCMRSYTIFKACTHHIIIECIWYCVPTTTLVVVSRDSHFFDKVLVHLLKHCFCWETIFFSWATTSNSSIHDFHIT